MTDYIDSLQKYRQSYIDSRTGKDTGITLSSRKEGLGAPTVEKEVTEEAEKGNLVANMLYRQYDAEKTTPYVGSSFDYEIKSGDTLSELAQEYGMSVGQIMSLNENNPAVKNKDLIFAGGTLKLALPKDRKAPVKVVPMGEAFDVDKIIYDMSKKYKIDYKLAKAVGKQESGLRIDAPAGGRDELGMFQVRGIALKDVNQHYGLDITKEELDPLNPNYNLQKSIEAGVAYLAMTRDRYKAQSPLEMAMMYNGGPNAVKSNNKKAKGYADSVMSLMKEVKPFEDLYGYDLGQGTKKKPQSFEKLPSLEATNLKGEAIDIGKLGLSVELTKELKNLKSEIDNSMQMDDGVALKNRIKKALEETYELLNELEEKETTFEDRVRGSFPKGSKFVDKILDDKTEEEKQSIVARPKRFVQ